MLSNSPSLNVALREVGFTCLELQSDIGGPREAFDGWCLAVQCSWEPLLEIIYQSRAPMGSACVPLQPARCVPPDRYLPMCPPGTLTWEFGGVFWGCFGGVLGGVPGVFWGCSGAVLVVFWGNPPRIRLEQRRTPPEHRRNIPHNTAKTRPEHPPQPPR